ncbi:hypothetical protein D3C85_765380 [compost metagenome]
MSSCKQPWGPNTPWVTSVQFFTYLRGCLRSSWSRNPIKHNLLKKKRKQIPNPNKNAKKPTVWGADCSMCGGEFVIKDIQVDHINPAGSLQKTEDIQGFIERLLYVTEDDLRLVCKGCNSALAYGDKHGVSYELACIEKIAIDMVKKKLDIAWLKVHNISPASSAPKRRAQIREILMEELNAKENLQ